MITWFPQVTIIIAQLGLSVVATDTQKPNGYASANECMMRLSQMIEVARRLPVDINMGEAACIPRRQA